MRRYHYSGFIEEIFSSWNRLDNDDKRHEEANQLMKLITVVTCVRSIQISRDLFNLIMLEELKNIADTIVWDNLTVSVPQERDFLKIVWRKFRKRRYEENLSILKGGDIERKFSICLLFSCSQKFLFLWLICGLFKELYLSNVK